jgi:hypothetical protein
MSTLICWYRGLKAGVWDVDAPALGSKVALDGLSVGKLVVAGMEMGSVVSVESVSNLNGIISYIRHKTN